MARQGDTQKSFYLRDTLAARFDRVIAARRKAGQKLSERRAFEMAMRAYVEAEEKALGLPPETAVDLLDRIGELLERARERLGGRA